MRAVVIDLGGVLVSGVWPGAAQDWSTRLGISPDDLMSAVFGGKDDQVLIGNSSEDAWWDIVCDRLRLDDTTLDELRGDLAARECWDQDLVVALSRVRAHAMTAIVSNAWPSARTGINEAGLLDLVDEVILSCGVGSRKPDVAIYEIALRHLGVHPADALFIDDAPENVEVADSLGMTGHCHTTATSTVTMIDSFVASSNLNLCWRLRPCSGTRPMAP